MIGSKTAVVIKSFVFCETTTLWVCADSSTNTMKSRPFTLFWTFGEFLAIFSCFLFFFFWQYFFFLSCDTYHLPPVTNANSHRPSRLAPADSPIIQSCTYALINHGQKLGKKFCILKTKNFGTDADSSTNTKKILLVWQNSSKIIFFAQRFYTLHEQTYSNLRPPLSISFPQGFRKSKKFGHWTLGSGGTKTFKWSEQRKKLFPPRNLRPFLSKNVHIWDHFFPLLFHKVSES